MANQAVDQHGAEQSPVEEQVGGPNLTAELQVRPDVPDPRPAIWGPTEMQAAICEAIREELDDPELTDDEIAEGFRFTDKFVVQGPDGKAMLEYTVGQPYPGLPNSWVVGIFTFPIEDSVPGDIRIYVAVPTLPVAGVADHICYTFNRATMTTRREKMTRAIFVDEVASEDARLFDDDDEDEDDETGDEGDEELDGAEGEGDEPEGPECAEEECDAPPTYLCVCEVCNRLGDDERFYACADHRGEMAGTHLKETGKPPKWVKRAPIVLAPAPPSVMPDGNA